jgi:hypothetical protein
VAHFLTNYSPEFEAANSRHDYVGDERVSGLDSGGLESLLAGIRDGGRIADRF